MSRQHLNPYLPERYRQYSGAVAQRAEDPLDNAKRHAEAADDNIRKLNYLIDTHLAALLGDWVHGTFGRLLEGAGEHHGEAVWHYADALAAREESCRRALADLDDARLALAQVAERLQARYATAHKPLPDELDQIVTIAAAKIGWYYLFPLGDERHEHAADAGGNCRNPACAHNSDQTEPF